MGSWMQYLSHQCDWYEPVLSVLCYENFKISIVLVSIAEYVFRKVIPVSDVGLKRLFVLEKLLIIFLMSPSETNIVRGGFDGILNLSVKKTTSSVLAIWFALNYSILSTLIYLDANIAEAPDMYKNYFRRTVLATLVFVFYSPCFQSSVRYSIMMSAEMFSIVAVQFAHMLLKSLRVLLTVEKPKGWNASFPRRSLIVFGLIFYTLESGTFYLCDSS
ncbi:hypothetical protein PMAYCL1PPCAC_23543 [Pristionchus mayeri]|uniref:Uncharacterized protein n=1 Tax=Pristionchus mayeri TaxID=1317129 RepID=A0AAN5CYW3_9BILA|nr:hypothetical protein PMAYCL1PPCAC_23543 [Pristionchus mayeri]